jgi:Holliday junction resolvase RusA-like endonuclease
MYSLTIELSASAADSNSILGVNKFTKGKIMKQAKLEVYHLVKGKAPKEPLTRFLITATRHGVRYLDYDNFIASLKPSIDGLTMGGIIQDDSWDFIKHISVDQVKSKEKKLVLTVEEF